VIAPRHFVHAEFTHAPYYAILRELGEGEPDPMVDAKRQVRLSLIKLQTARGFARRASSQQRGARLTESRALMGVKPS
jgi:hypothetical protein